MSAILHRALRVFVGCVALSVCAQSVVSARAADEPVSNAPLSNEAVLLRALDRPVSVNFKNDSIRDAIDILIDRLPPEDKISMAIDQRALSKAEVDLDAKVTLKATNIRLSSALDFVLGQVGAAWTIKDEMLLITTGAVANVQMMVLKHDLDGLMIRDEDADGGSSFRQLIKLLRAGVAPDSWNVGGASVEVFERRGFSQNAYHLVVRQTPAVQVEIARLLTELRANPPICAAEKKIRKALAGPTALEFVEAPLNDVVAYLHDLHQIEILFDFVELEYASISLDQPITKTLRGISLKSALDLILDPLDLRYTIKDEVLFITTKPESQRKNRGGTF